MKGQLMQNKSVGRERERERGRRLRREKSLEPVGFLSCTENLNC